MTEQPINRTQAWLESLRPKTLPLAFAAIVVGTTLAWHQVISIPGWLCWR